MVKRSGLDQTHIIFTTSSGVHARPLADFCLMAMLTRNNPIDMLDLVRWYPGGEGGWLTEKIAHKIITDFWSQCDYMINFHSGGAAGTGSVQWLSAVQPK